MAVKIARRIHQNLESVRTLADRAVMEMRLVSPEAVDAAVEIQIRLASAQSAVEVLMDLTREEGAEQTSP